MIWSARSWKCLTSTLTSTRACMPSITLSCVPSQRSLTKTFLSNPLTRTKPNTWRCVCACVPLSLSVCVCTAQVGPSPPSFIDGMFGSPVVSDCHLSLCPGAVRANARSDQRCAPTRGTELGSGGIPGKSNHFLTRFTHTHTHTGPFLLFPSPPPPSAAFRFLLSCTFVGAACLLLIDGQRNVANSLPPPLCVLGVLR